MAVDVRPRAARILRVSNVRLEAAFGAGVAADFVEAADPAFDGFYCVAEHAALGFLLVGESYRKLHVALPVEEYLGRGQAVLGLLQLAVHLLQGL